MKSGGVKRKRTAASSVAKRVGRINLENNWSTDKLVLSMLYEDQNKGLSNPI